MGRRGRRGGEGGGGEGGGAGSAGAELRRRGGDRERQHAQKNREERRFRGPHLRAGRARGVRRAVGGGGGGGSRDEDVTFVDGANSKLSLFSPKRRPSGIRTRHPPAIESPACAAETRTRKTPACGKKTRERSCEGSRSTLSGPQMFGSRWKPVDSGFAAPRFRKVVARRRPHSPRCSRQWCSRAPRVARCRIRSRRCRCRGWRRRTSSAAAGAGVNYGQVGGGVARSGPARRPGEEAFVSLLRLRSLPSARGTARDRRPSRRSVDAPRRPRRARADFRTPLASLPPHQVDVPPRVHRKRPADAPGDAPRELVPSRGAHRGAPILPPRLRPQPGRRGRGPRGGPGRGTERAEHVHQAVRPPSPPPPAPTPDRAARPRRPRDVRNVGGRTSAVPFSARVPRRMMTDRSRFRERRLRSDRHPRLATRSSAARRGGDGRRTRARSRLGVLPSVLLSPPPRRGAPATDALFDPFRELFFEHL